MNLFLIDAIGPFFRGIRRKRVNWSKIPFTHLAAASEEDWLAIEDDLRTFARGICSQGYNAVSLDDLAHLAHHPLHEPEIVQNISFLRKKFRHYFRILQSEFGLQVYLTSDVIPTTPEVSAALKDNPLAWENYYCELVRETLDDFPELSGLILRIGESDGQDVKDPIRTRLHLKSPKQANQLLHRLLPIFEKRKTNLILRTWTVGVHQIGDLIWHPKTLDRTLEGLDSDRLIVSMKHSESDFFRYLPVNPSILRIRHQVILELQARREYEGAGEYPSFIGWDCEKFRAELANASHVIGISVWCQTGGWHRFHRRAFLEKENRDIWIRLNTAAAISVFKYNEPAVSAIRQVIDSKAIELIELSEQVIRDLVYISDFAKQTWYFRRIRIPPIVHIYWDSIFINHAMRKIMRHFVPDPEWGLLSGENTARQFPRMIELAKACEVPVEDIEHMRDLCHILLLARRYYFLPYDQKIIEQIKQAKKDYKAKWPQEKRYRIKLSMEPFPIRRRSIAVASRIFLRNQQGYRLIDRLFMLYLTSLAYRFMRPWTKKRTPKFLRKSAMGVDVLFK